MKKSILVLCTMLMSICTQAQSYAIDSIAGGGYVQNISGSNWMNYLLAPNEASQEFILKESLTSKPSCYGYIFITEDRQSGAVCYVPKSMWQDKDLQASYVNNDENWINILLVKKKNPEFFGRTYDRLYAECNADGSEIYGLWYFDKITTEDFVTYHGNWTNAKPFEDGFKSYYIQFL
jgi:hypothetical protein